MGSVEPVLRLRDLSIRLRRFPETPWVEMEIGDEPVLYVRVRGRSVRGTLPGLILDQGLTIIIMLRYDSGWVFHHVISDVRPRPATSWEELRILGPDLLLVEVTVHARREIVNWVGRRFIWVHSERRWFRARWGT